MVRRYIRDGRLFRDKSAGSWDFSTRTQSPRESYETSPRLRPAPLLSLGLSLNQCRLSFSSTQTGMLHEAQDRLFTGR
jgi:hypothetical protein